MTKIEDLTDIEGQLKAIDDWLETLHERVTADHTGLGAMPLNQARHRVQGALTRVVREKESLIDECKKLPH